LDRGIELLHVLGRAGGLGDPVQERLDAVALLVLGFARLKFGQTRAGSGQLGLELRCS
jgi:hypothetical protein